MNRQALLCAAAVLLAACNGTQAAVTVEQAWIPEAPPGAGVMAGYLTVLNGTDKALRCDGASGADFGAAEIHRTTIEDGQSRMLRDQIIEVPPGGRVKLAPGGLHLMLFRPQRALRAGDQTQLDLRCGEVTVRVTFRIDRRN